MIERVHVKGYKSLSDAELVLRPLTVIIGPNAAGKSNLFDALGLLSRLGTADTLIRAFDDHRGVPLEAFHFDAEGLPGAAVKESLRFTIEVDVFLSDAVVDATEQHIRTLRQDLDSRTKASESDQRHPRVTHRRLRYRLSVEMLVASGVLRVADEYLAPLTKQGRVARRPAAFIERVGGKLRLRREGQARPTEHDLGLDRTLLSTPLYAPHYPHVTAFREELQRWRFYYLEPEVMRTESALKSVAAIGPHGDDLAAFYNTLKEHHPRQFEAIDRSLSSLLPSADGLGIERTDEGRLRLIVRENGTPYSARVISEGTLRILGMLAMTSSQAQTTVVGFEEPENGVHPRRLTLVAELVRNATAAGKQVLINTHSPELPEHFDFDDLILCRRFDSRTEFVPFTEFFGRSGPLIKRGDIERALAETPISERLQRGDFGG